MNIDGWSYYNHAAVPTVAPDEAVNLSPIEDKSIWNISGGFPLLSRWTTDFDCGCETNFWYVIKDTPFDISSLKAKRRYVINKGIKNFIVKEINPLEHKETLFEIQRDAYAVYPKKYRPQVNREAVLKDIESWNKYVVFGAFFRETEELVGYALMVERDGRCVDFKALKVKPDFEKYSVNAALVEGMLQRYQSFLSEGGYICDGSRNVNHETAFQDYLEKTFGFRKAYCKLHIVYNPKVEWIIKILFVFRKVLLKLDTIKIVHQINGVLRMEEIRREEGSI